MYSRLEFKISGVRVIEGKINCINCMENVLKGMKLLRVSGRFELKRVRVTGR